MVMLSPLDCQTFSVETYFYSCVPFLLQQNKPGKNLEIVALVQVWNEIKVRSSIPFSDSNAVSFTDRHSLSPLVIESPLDHSWAQRTTGMKQITFIPFNSPGLQNRVATSKTLTVKSFWAVLSHARQLFRHWQVTKEKVLPKIQSYKQAGSRAWSHRLAPSDTLGQTGQSVIHPGFTHVSIKQCKANSCSLCPHHQ